jgi:hypothetical protein
VHRQSYHVRTHTQNDTVQIAGLGSVAKDFTPAWFVLIRFRLDSTENLLQLAHDLVIIKGLVEQATDNALGLQTNVSSIVKCYEGSNIPRQSFPCAPTT